MKSRESFEQDDTVNEQIHIRGLMHRDGLTENRCLAH
jgi:hypothetical protein